GLAAVDERRLDSTRTADRHQASARATLPALGRSRHAAHRRAYHARRPGTRCRPQCAAAHPADVGARRGDATIARDGNRRWQPAPTQPLLVLSWANAVLAKGRGAVFRTQRPEQIFRDL